MYVCVKCQLVVVQLYYACLHVYVHAYMLLLICSMRVECVWLCISF